MEQRYSNCPSGSQDLINSCKAKKDLYYLLSTNLDLKLIVSPVWTNIPSGVGNDSAVIVSDFDILGSGESSQCDIVQNNCIRDAFIGKYMRIATNNSHSLELSDRTNYSATDKSIDIPIVQKYSEEDSIEIYTALFNTLCNRASCRAGKGNNIIFEPDGNLAIKKVSGAVKRIPNTTLGTEDLQIFNIKSLDFDIDSLSASNDAGLYQTARVGVLDISQQFFMSHNGKYIVYTPKKVGNTPSRATPATGSMSMQSYTAAGRPIYYLLYNPIHSHDFSRFYRLLLEANSPPTTVNRTIYSDDYGGYSKNTALVVTGKTSLEQMNIQPFRILMARYCNAFKIKSNFMSNGRKSEIYLDPVCSLALDEETAQLCSILGKNYTQECLTYDYWAKTTASTSSQIDLDNGSNGISILLDSPLVTALSHTWACDTHTSSEEKTVVKWLKRSGILGNSSYSFINSMANAVAQDFGKSWVENTNRVPINYVLGDDNKIQLAACAPISVGDITICSQVMNFTGDADLDENEFNFVNACGGGVTPNTAGPPVIVSFTYGFGDTPDLLEDHYALVLLPIFTGGTGQITTIPESALPIFTDRSAISSVTSGKEIFISKINPRPETTFQLKVTNAADQSFVISTIKVPLITNNLTEAGRLAAQAIENKQYNTFFLPEPSGSSGSNLPVLSTAEQQAAAQAAAEALEANLLANSLLPRGYNVRDVVDFTINVSGQLSDFTTAVINSMKLKLSTKALISVTNLYMSVTTGTGITPNVNINAGIFTDTFTEQNRVLTLMTTALSTTALSTTSPDTNLSTLFTGINVGSSPLLINRVTKAPVITKRAKSIESIIKFNGRISDFTSAIQKRIKDAIAIKVLVNALDVYMTLTAGTGTASNPGVIATVGIYTPDNSTENTRITTAITSALNTTQHQTDLFGSIMIGTTPLEVSSVTQFPVSVFKIIDDDAPQPVFVNVVEFIVKFGGELSSFTPTVVNNLKNVIATQAGVNVSKVNIVLSEGSVIVKSTIDVSTQSEMARIIGVMADALLTPETVNNLFANVKVNNQPLQVLQVRQRPRATTRAITPGTNTSLDTKDTGDTSETGSMWIWIVAILLAILVILYFILLGK